MCYKIEELYENQSDVCDLKHRGEEEGEQGGEEGGDERKKGERCDTFNFS